jgi:hypothetical protein
MIGLLLTGIVFAGVSQAQERSRSRRAAKDKDEEPKVLSEAEAERLRLKLKGSTDRYGDGVDWRSLPPWAQTTFFGIRARGQFFVYVVDRSGSMIEEERLVRAKLELRRSIRGLREPQRFAVIFYNERPWPFPGDLSRSADLPSKDAFTRWLRLIEPDGGTDPRKALSMALSLRPDAVFLLSDGEFPPGTAESIARQNPRKVPIHCIDLAGGTGGSDLARIAANSGGQYVSRPQSLGGFP